MFDTFVETISHLFHPRRSNRYRSKIIHPEALLALSAVIFVAVAGVYQLAPYYSNLVARSGSVLGYASDITIPQVLEKTNAARQTAGLPALKLDSDLSLAASYKAAHMMKNQYWAHTAPTGEDPWYFFKKVGYSYKTAGENLARDFGNTNDMVQAWLASPTHRANIMNSRYQETGIAVLNGTLHGVETTLVVQMFGTRQNQIAKVTPRAVSIENGTEAAEKFAGEKATKVVDETVTGPGAQPEVLAKTAVPEGSILPQHYYQPLDIVKSVVMSSTILLILALLYDWYAIRHHKKARVVGKNLAHILLLFTVLLLVMMVKMGRVI